MAGLYNGHLLEFPQIRVDCFTTSTPSRPHLIPSESSSSTSPWVKAPNARLYLLTHVHTDHLVGLSNAFTGKIVCSPDTKRMLLRLEPEIERERLDIGVREQKVLKYDGLKRRTKGEGKVQRVVDIIETIPYGEAREYELGYDNGEPYKVSITLLDANHCPGSTMFLIRSRDKAVLHTGDVRADRAFLKSLRSNPALSEFVEPATISPFPQVGNWGKKTLDRIYLDTSAVLGTGDMPDRDPVLAELVEQMSMYPGDTIFFLNVWCFGWEQVVKAVASHFRSPVHLDRYKRSIYAAVETDPFLLACTTSDPSATRFHACERRFKCVECRTFDKSGKRVWNEGRRVVHVNMVEVKAATWDIQQVAFRDKLGKAACGEGDWPFNIECPIARHSPLPELQALVELFRPRAVSPNCVVPMLRGLDYFLLPNFLMYFLQPNGYEIMLLERDAWFHSAMCFIRDGTNCLAALKKQQEMGLDLLSAIEPGGDGRFEDYMPTDSLFTDTKPRLGLGRRQIGSDQAMRAGQLFGVNTPAAGTSISHVCATVSEAVPSLADAIMPEIELSDTDNEEHQQKRRRSANGRSRRRHLRSPTSARTRVLSSQAKQSSKQIKTEEVMCASANPLLEETSPCSPRHRMASERKHARLVVGSIPMEMRMEDLKRLPLKLNPRLRVDSQHLAALMAVGTSPPSSP